MNYEELNQYLKGQLIVSCQALEDEPLYREDASVMDLMAKAAVLGGAKAIRAQGIRDIIAIKKAVKVPIIGIIKKVYEGYEGYITMTMQEVDALVEVGCDIVAIDATNRRRADGLNAYQFIEQIKQKYPKILLMADISCEQEAILAQNAGCDYVGTTLSGYTSYTETMEGPDYHLIEKLSKTLTIPVIAEGKIHYPYQAKQALKLGAHCVVVGGAITRPMEITTRFVREIKEEV